MAGSQEGRKEQIRSLIAPGMETASAGQKTDAVADAMSKDGATINAMGLEKPFQSRVTWGAISAFILALIGWLQFVIGSMPFDFVSFDFTMFFALTGAIGGTAYTLYGRWKPGLKPLFWDDEQ